MRFIIPCKTLLFVLLALAAANMSAATVDATSAQAMAVRFMNSQQGTRFMASNANVRLTYTEESSVKADAAAFYVFNYDGGGFVIVAGDDRAEEILGYGDGYLDMEKIPANMRWWLSTYKEQIDFLFKNPGIKVKKLSESTSTLRASTVVSPLLTCIWDQDAPFYNQCPTRSGVHCLTGCVATAMAQVMYYWKYPAQAPALSAYTTSTRRISMPALSATTLDWNNMIDDYTGSYTNAQGTAVATLMLYCGQSCYMDYDTESNGGSGAYTDDQLTGMKAFGYNSGATYVQRANYTDAQWTAMMLEDLQAGRPILYGGDDGTYGHAFVVDGYNGSKYHINWGWSGIDNNYFAISSFMIDSDYDFRKNQDMLYQIYPEGQGGITKVAPVMADASSVGTTSFTAIWTDETASENVTDYTLYVNAYTPGQNETLLSETFGGATSAGNTNISSNLDEYCDNSGWTGSYIYPAEGGLRMGSSNYAGSLTTPALDLSTSGGTITVKFNSKYWSSSDNTSITVSCGSASQSVQLTGDATDYTIVLSGVSATSGQKVTFASSSGKKRFYIYNVEVLTGDASTMLRSTETGDANSRVITGITSKMYTVTGLNQGGSYRFYVVANYTDGTSKESNVKTVTLDGTAVPNPELVVDYNNLEVAAVTGETATVKFNVLGSDLTGNVTLTLSDANGVFAINPTTISIANAENGAEVTVTYAPTQAGTHTATITVSSEGAEDEVVIVTGTATAPAIVTVAPVMAAATNVGTTSFTATWTDETAAANVTDYTLYVNKVTATGNLLLAETFAGVNVTRDGTIDRGETMDDYCDNAGWTGYAAYEALSGGFKLGSGSKIGYITTPALAQNSGTIIVNFNANSYNNDGSSLIVSCGDVSETVALTATADDYSVTLTGVNAAQGQQVTFSCTGTSKRVYIHSVNIYDGVAATLNATETGNADSRVITGITAKTYTVENLTAGATYSFYVVANYTDGTNANSNTEQVTLLSEPVVPTPEMIVDPENLSFAANVGETMSATFDMLATDLTGVVTVTLNDETGMFTVTPETISIADAEEGAAVTVTYAPTAVGTHTATITVSSEGAEDVTVTVTGTAEMPLGALVMLPADETCVTTSSFRADWTDETNAAYVQDYTLYVNIKQQADTIVVPGEATSLLKETFYSEEVPSIDDNRDLGENNELDENCDNAGWTGYAVYLAGGGGMKLGANKKLGYLTTPALDLTNCGGTITVKLTAKAYSSSENMLIVSCGEVADTLELDDAAFADYSVVLTGVPAQANQNVTISCVAAKMRFYLTSVEVLSGDASSVATLKAVNETGDANSRIITGITDKYYVVENLTAGATYDYYVVANYIDGTHATSNVEAVTLLESGDHGYQPGDVNHDGAVDVGDVTLTISYILGNTTGDFCEICANVNSDEGIDVADVTAIIAIILGE